MVVGRRPVIFQLNDETRENESWRGGCRVTQVVNEGPSPRLLKDQSSRRWPMETFLVPRTRWEEGLESFEEWKQRPHTRHQRQFVPSLCCFAVAVSTWLNRLWPSLGTWLICLSLSVTIPLGPKSPFHIRNWPIRSSYFSRAFFYNQTTI